MIIRGQVGKTWHASTKIEVPDYFAGTYAIKVIHFFDFIIDAPVENNPSEVAVGTRGKPWKTTKRFPC